MNKLMTPQEAITELMDGCRDDASCARIAGVIRAQDEAYHRLHSQVSGYLYGEEWEHWKKYNEPRFAPGVNTK